jgi:hypothetical protein
LSTFTPPTTAPETTAPEYITIHSGDADWNSDVYRPILVNMAASNNTRLVYTLYDTAIPNGLWKTYQNILPFNAYPNIQAAIAAQTPETHSPELLPGVTIPGGGSGKRTRKNKKSKTSNRKKHQSMRKRRRA